MAPTESTINNRRSELKLPSLIAKDLVKINRAIDRWYEKKRQTISEAVNSCEHPIEAIFEKPYKERGWVGCDRPWLICSKCGYTEEGWGCGYKKLKHAEYKKLPQISDEDWNQMSTVRVFQKDI